MQINSPLQHMEKYQKSPLNKNAVSERVRTTNSQTSKCGVLKQPGELSNHRKYLLVLSKLVSFLYKCIFGLLFLCTTHTLKNRFLKFSLWSSYPN